MNASFRRITTICVIIILLFPARKCWKLRNLPQNVSELVRGGEPAALGELPYQIAFKERHTKDPTRFYTFCGGAIIGKAKILSAAHCFVGREWKLCIGFKTFAKSLEGKYAVAGTVRNIANFKGGIEAQWRNLQDVVYPEDYEYPNHDIAVLFVVTPFKYNEFVKPIRMAEWYVDYEGLCLISGYGEVSYSKSSDSLLKAYLFSFPHKVCSKLNPDRDMYLMICTSVEVADIGRGDSGGPLVYSQNYGDKSNKTLIGIACGTHEDRNSLFVRVSAYRDFIAKNHCEEDMAFYYFVVGPPLLRKGHPSEIVNNISYVKHPEYKKWISRIMNGWEATLGDVPYQIALKGLADASKNLYKTFCGATIISPRKLISAAHCFVEREFDCSKLFPGGEVRKSLLKDKYAVAGNLYNVGKYSARDDSSNGQWRELESGSYPKKYKFPMQDIAVLFTVYPFVFTEYIKPIRIATRRNDYTGKCLASGFGRTGHGPQDQAEVLFVAQLVLFPTSVCNKIYEMPMKHYICTSSSFTDVGKGDSGGPLVCSETGDPNEKDNKMGLLVGVVSGHHDKAGSFFSRVSRYHKFIASVNSVAVYKYNMQSCTVIAMSVLYKTFVLF